jgi:hypothetical protein
MFAWRELYKEIKLAPQKIQRSKTLAEEARLEISLLFRGNVGTGRADG